MQRWTWVRVLGVLLLAQTVHAGPPTADFAAAQLEFAETALRQAKDAYAGGDYALARRLASQAALDARLAWSMSHELSLRRIAADANRRAEILRSRAAQEAEALSLP